MVELRVRREVCSPELGAGVVIPGNQCVKSNSNLFTKFAKLLPQTFSFLKVS